MDAPITTPTVVLVDDEVALLSALKFSLEIEGFHVETHRLATTVRAADLPKSNACLVIDYFLPGWTGLQLLRRLRDAGVRLGAIVITSRITDDLRREAAALGAATVEKPLLGPELVGEIRSQLAQHAHPAGGSR